MAERLPLVFAGCPGDGPAWFYRTWVWSIQPNGCYVCFNLKRPLKAMSLASDVFFRFKLFSIRHVLFRTSKSSFSWSHRSQNSQWPPNANVEGCFSPWWFALTLHNLVKQTSALIVLLVNTPISVFTAPDAVIFELVLPSNKFVGVCFDYFWQKSFHLVLCNSFSHCSSLLAVHLSTFVLTSRCSLFWFWSWSICRRDARVPAFDLAPGGANCPYCGKWWFHHSAIL